MDTNSAKSPQQGWLLNGSGASYQDHGGRLLFGLDADVVQIDEANIPGSLDEWQWAAAATNRVLDAVKTTPAVHLCFGNYGGRTIQKG